MSGLYECLVQSANWWTIGLLFVLVLVCLFGFSGRILALRRQTAIGNEKLLDGRWWYSPEVARDLLAKLGRDGRSFYAWTELTIDVIFAFAYGTLAALLLVRLWPETGALVLLLPLVTVIADLIENVLIAILAWTFDGKASGLAKVAAFFTLTKHVFGVLVGLAILLGIANVTIGLESLLVGIVALFVILAAVAVVLVVIKWPTLALPAAAVLVVIAALTVGVVPLLAAFGAIAIVLVAVLVGVLRALA